MPHRQCEERKRAVPGESHLQYEVQCELRVYSVRWATPAVGGQSVLCEEKVFSIRNVQYQEGRICSTKRKLCSARRECPISEGLHLQ